MKTTITEDTHRTQLSSTTKEKDGIKEKENSSIQKARVKVKVAEKAETTKGNETRMTSKNLKRPTTVNE